MAPQKQELKIYENGEHNTLQVALNHLPLINRPKEDLNEVLRFIMLKIGLRAANLPSKIETQVLMDHILTNYGNHTCEEIKLAFDMAIAGKLDVEVNCYENFSCLYFSSIMNAYRSWSRQEKRFLDNQRSEPEQKIYSEEDILNERRAEIELKYQAMRKGKVLDIPPYLEEVIKKDFLCENVSDLLSQMLNNGVENIYTYDSN